MKQFERDRQSADVAEAEDQNVALNSKLDRIVQLIDEVDEQLQSIQFGDIASIELLAQFYRYRSHLRQDQLALIKRQRQTSAKVDSKRRDLIEADRDVKVVEKLSEKRQLETNRQQAAHELRAADEASSQQAARSRLAG